jgi:integrase
LERIQDTTEEFKECNEFNRQIYEEFLRNSTELSPDSLSAYRSNLRIWFVWVKNNLDDKRQIDILGREYLFFQNWLINLGHSSSDISNKRSAISSLNNYIVLYYPDKYPTFRNFITKAIKKPEKAFVHDKVPLTKDEFSNLISELEKMKKWQHIAYLKFSYSTGCRRSEARQLRKDIINTKLIIKKKLVKNEQGIDEEKEVKYYLTPLIRCKGKGKTGEVRKLKFDVETMDALRKWVDERGEDDCPYMFVAKNKNSCKQVNRSTFNDWCAGIFSTIVGRRVHPHLTRESRATAIVVEEGKDISAAQKLLGHKSSETTQIYVIRDDSEDADDLFIDD